MSRKSTIGYFFRIDLKDRSVSLCFASSVQETEEKAIRAIKNWYILNQMKDLLISESEGKSKSFLENLNRKSLFSSKYNKWRMAQYKKILVKTVCSARQTLPRNMVEKDVFLKMFSKDVTGLETLSPDMTAKDVPGSQQYTFEEAESFIKARLNFLIKFLKKKKKQDSEKPTK